MSVRVGDAKSIARRWVEDEAAGSPGFVGAYLAGSVLDLPDDAPLPETSDLDVNVVVAEGAGPGSEQSSAMAASSSRSATSRKGCS